MLFLMAGWLLLLPTTVIMHGPDLNAHEMHPVITTVRTPLAAPSQERRQVQSLKPRQRRAITRMQRWARVPVTIQKDCTHQRGDTQHMHLSPTRDRKSLPGRGVATGAAREAQRCRQEGVGVAAGGGGRRTSGVAALEADGGGRRVAEAGGVVQQTLADLVQAGVGIRRHPPLPRLPPAHLLLRDPQQRLQGQEEGLGL